MKKIELPIRLAVILGAIIGITLLHYSTPLTKPMLHDVFQRLYYLPIILAAFWFGLKGGIGTALIVTIVYAPHIIFQWGDRPMLENIGDGSI